MQQKVKPVRPPIIAIDINVDEVPATGTAFFPLPQEVIDFLNKVHKHHGILGFHYNPYDGVFGAIVQTVPDEPGIIPIVLDI